MLCVYRVIRLVMALALSRCSDMPRLSYRRERRTSLGSPVIWDLHWASSEKTFWAVGPQEPPSASGMAGAKPIEASAHKRAVSR